MPKLSAKEKQLLKMNAKSNVISMLDKAESVFNSNKALSSDLVRKARRLSMKYRLRLPREVKRRFCKHCLVYLKPGINARVRTRDGKLIIYCFDCKKFTRFGLK